MAFYHPTIAAAAQTALGRPLQRFSMPTDDPSVNNAAQTPLPAKSSARSRKWADLARAGQLFRRRKFEVLFPYDVNHPTPAGIHQIGGRLESIRQSPGRMGIEGEQQFRFA